MATRDPDGSGDIDVRATLAGLAPPATTVEVSAGFFHRTLARWLGLPEGKQPGRKKSAPPLWDYDFWKAELHADDDAGAGPASGNVTYCARLFRSAAGEPEVVRYWVKLDASGRIHGSGWLTQAPALLDDPSAGDAQTTRAFPGPTAVQASQVDAIYRDTDVE